MKVVIGSILIILLFIFGFWLILSPTFSKVGDKTKQIKNILSDEENNTK